MQETGFLFNAFFYCHTEIPLDFSIQSLTHSLTSLTSLILIPHPLHHAREYSVQPHPPVHCASVAQHYSDEHTASGVVE